MQVKPTKIGRGVFATKHYKAGDVIELSPVIVLSRADSLKIDSTLLYDYYFSWGEQGDQVAIALGFGSLFNHSYTPNATYKKHDATIEFVALRPIDKGQQILVNYNGDPADKTAMWFRVETKV